MVKKTNNKNSSVGNNNFNHFFSFKAEMCNRTRLVIDLVIDCHFFQSNRNRNRAFLQNSNRNRNRNPVKKIAFDDYK